MELQAVASAQNIGVQQGGSFYNELLRGHGREGKAGACGAFYHDSAAGGGHFQHHAARTIVDVTDWCARAVHYGRRTSRTHLQRFACEA